MNRMRPVLLVLISCFTLASCDILDGGSDGRSTKGEFVYYASNNQIFRYDVEDDKTETLLTISGALDLTFDINPNGRQLVVEALYQGNFNPIDSDLYLYDIKDDVLDPIIGKKVVNPLSPSDSVTAALTGTSPTWSPDGRFIAFGDTSFSQLGVNDINIYDTETESVSVLDFNTVSDTPVYWSRDSQEIYFRSRRGGSNSLFKINIYTLEIEFIFRDQIWLNSDYNNSIGFYERNETIQAFDYSTSETNLFYRSDFENIDISGFWGRQGILLYQVNTINPETELITYSAHLLNLSTRNSKTVYSSNESETNYGNFRYFNSSR